MAGFLEEVAMDVGIVRRQDRYWPTSVSGVGEDSHWSGDDYEQESFIEMRAHD